MTINVAFRSAKGDIELQITPDFGSSKQAV